jgi:hypothetical protein
VRAELDGWRTTTTVGGDGSVESDQRAVAPAPVVEPTVAGALELARAYWLSLERAVLHTARVVDRPGGAEVRVLGRGPALLRFAPAVTDAGADRVCARFAIRGGLLARRPGGEIAFAQERAAEGWIIRATVRGFAPRLPLVLYHAVQKRVHVAVGRRYVGALLDTVRNGQ